MWWTGGSAIVEPSCLIAKGLPHPDVVRGVAGRGVGAHRLAVGSGARGDATAAATPDTLVENSRRRVFDRPARRTSAACAASIRTRCSNGPRSDSGPSPTVSAATETAKSPARWSAMRWRTSCPDAQLRADDRGRRRTAARGERPSRSRGGTFPRCVLSGSTVVALLARGTSCAILWAGDSRVYQMREGPAGTTHARPQSGGRVRRTRRLSLQHRDARHRRRADAGARRLSRSRARRRSIPPLLRRPDAHRVQRRRSSTGWNTTDIRAAVEGLIGATLAAGAPDNVTALIVEAYS